MLCTPFNLVVTGTLLAVAVATVRADDGEAAHPWQIFRQHCVHCHGADETIEGEVNLAAIGSEDDLQSQLELVEKLIGVLDSGLMPPEDEPPLADAQREAVVARLQDLLRVAIAARDEMPRAPIRRMNRFQYNNAVQDLFQLSVEVFSLPERMLREYGDYFQPQTGQMPEELKAGSRPLGKSQLIEPRLGGVTAFPQDLRAEHGFDNRADHLTLSPLLLESLLTLGRSIVESEDFNRETCGIWPEFFTPPATEESTEIELTVRSRLEPFLTRAFRRPVDGEVLDRYAAHVLARIADGESFTVSMKSVAAAAIASPQFFYLYDEANENAETKPSDDFDLASRLSFFLWGSIPDATLLDVAAAGKLGDPDILTEQVDRMLRDRRLRRFCDSFPAQWLQLERIISSTPDPEQFPQFYFAKEGYRATMHMMLEPLLLFETVLVEDQSILKFIDSDFSYRSDLLEAWYRDGTQGDPGPPLKIQFRRVPVTDRRQGGLITSAAVMTMTSGPARTQPITRGAWVSSVILNDPPEPPPANVPPLVDEQADDQEPLALRERFAAHRERADCAGCHEKIDPLGFALENYDAAGIWRDTYANGLAVDASGTLFGRHDFADLVDFKEKLLAEKDRFTRGFAAHLLSFALGREVGVADTLALDRIVDETAAANYRFQTLIKQIALSEPFRR